MMRAAPVWWRHLRWDEWGLIMLGIIAVAAGVSVIADYFINQHTFVDMLQCVIRWEDM